MRKFLYKFCFISIFLPISLCYLGCQVSDTDKTLKKVTLNLQEGDPPSLHPCIGVDLRSRCLELALHEPLMRRNSEGLLEPAAAMSVEIDPSQRIYTFHLRPHLWSNGERVTADHFVQAWRYALDPQSPCVRSDLFYPITHAERVKKGELPPEQLKISAPDEMTFIVELDHPTPYFLDLTASSFFAPLYRATQEEPTVFSGPFVIKEHIADLKLVYGKNPYYWDRDSVQLDEVVFTMVKDPLTALAMYEKGEIDLVGDPLSSLPFDAIPALDRSGRLHKKLISRIFYLLINNTAAPFTEPLIRKALSLSLDRNALVEHLFFGEHPTLTLLPDNLSLNSARYRKSDEDPKALFEQGLKNLGIAREAFPKVVFSYAELSGQKKLGEFVQEQWKEKLGIETELICSEWNVHVSRLRTRAFQIGTLHLTTHYQDPMFYFDLYRDDQSRSNYCGWEHPKFRALLEESERTLDPQKRRKHLEEAEWLLYNEMPVIPLFTQNLQYLVQDRLNLVISDLGIYDFKWTRVRD